MPETAYVPDPRPVPYTFHESIDLGSSGLGGGSGGSGGLQGAGSPEGVVTADPGTTYVDSTGHAFYVKETGSGNTGWLQYV